MVLLTITPLILEGMRELDESNHLEEFGEYTAEETTEPSLAEPQLGNPISHGQIIDISRKLKANGHEKYTLEALLKGSRIYVPPPKPKPEPTTEYKELMARLRQEQEFRTYEQMTQAPRHMENFSQRFPGAFPSYAPTEEDEITYADVKRQMTLIFNVLISIFCCAAALWIAARHWSTIERLTLAMSGSIIVAVIEVAIYSLYIRRMRLAKTQEGKIKEVKEIVNTWVVGGEENEKSEVIILGKDSRGFDSLRNRRRAKVDTT